MSVSKRSLPSRQEVATETGEIIDDDSIALLSWSDLNELTDYLIAGIVVLKYSRPGGDLVFVVGDGRSFRHSDVVFGRGLKLGAFVSRDDIVFSEAAAYRTWSNLLDVSGDSGSMRTYREGVLVSAKRGGTSFVYECRDDRVVLTILEDGEAPEAYYAIAGANCGAIDVVQIH